MTKQAPKVSSRVGSTKSDRQNVVLVMDTTNQQPKMNIIEAVSETKQAVGPQVVKDDEAKSSRAKQSRANSQRMIDL